MKYHIPPFLLGCGRYEMEMNLHMVVEADSARLRGVLGDIKLSIGDLENHLTGLKEELLYIKKNHEEVPFQCTLTNLTNYFTRTVFGRVNASFSPLLFYRICICCGSSKAALLMWRWTVPLSQTLTRSCRRWERSMRCLLRKTAERLKDGSRARWASRTSSPSRKQYVRPSRGRWTFLWKVTVF